MSNQTQLTLKQIEAFIEIGNKDSEATPEEVAVRAGFSYDQLGKPMKLGANGHAEVTWTTPHGIILFKDQKLSLLTKPKSEPMAQTNGVQATDYKHNPDAVLIPLEKIKVKKGFNARKDFGDMEVLTSSIKAAGQKVPITVIDEGKFFRLTHGERRYKAMTELGFKEASVILLDPNTSEADIEISQLLLNDGKPLNLLEQGEVYARLEKLGMDRKTIAKRTGYSVTHIRDCSLVADAPDELKESVTKGEVSASAAKEVVKQNTKKGVTDKEAVIRQLHEAKAAPKSKQKGSTKITGRTLTGKGKPKKEVESIGMSTNLKLDTSKSAIVERAEEVYTTLVVTNKAKQYSESDIWDFLHYVLMGQLPEEGTSLKELIK